MNDDLRDYRFYADDLKHPTSARILAKSPAVGFAYRWFAFIAG